MKIRHLLLPKEVTIVMLALIAVFNLVSSFYGLSILFKTLSLIVLPLLLLFYFYKEKSMANIFLVIFILFFLGIAFDAFDNFSLFSKLSETSFLGAYSLIVFVMIGKLKDIKFESLISWYLIFILFVNTYLMYLMFASVKDNFQDSVVLTLTISKCVVLLIMGFLAFAIYLSRETMQSIIFFTVVCCLAFADVLGFITTMYIEFWLFAALHNILQAMALTLFCMYVYKHHKKEKTCVVEADSIAQSNPITIEA